jgi:protein phosphatase
VLNRKLNLEPAQYEIVASVQTDPGCVREANEDAGRFFKPSDPSLLSSKGIITIVADGMGGHLAGEVASGLAVELISRAYYREPLEACESLRQAFVEANRHIYEASLQDETLAGMGTTCTALILLNGSAFAAHVGDSRLYLVRDGEVYLMTEDHSAVMEMVRQGIIGVEEARAHTDKNVILRALGTNPHVEVETWEQPMEVRTGDQFLLCSDGLYDLVNDDEIKEVMTAALDPHAVGESLIKLALERGAPDNITVGVVSIKPAGFMKRRGARITRELETME